MRRHVGLLQSLRVHHPPQNGEVASTVSLRTSSAFTVALYLLFVICYLPQIVILCINATYASYGAKNVPKILLRCTTTLVFVNSSLNPLIYYWKMRRFRQAVLHALRKAFSK